MFIECTAVDYTKAIITLNTIVSVFSQYCGDEFTVEQVEVHYEKDGTKQITPDYSAHDVEVDVDYVNTLIGINLGINFPF